MSTIDTFDIGEPVAYRAITSITATGFHADDLAIQPNANTAVVTIETNVVRIRFDGTAPTSTTGNILATGTYIFKGQTMIRNLQFIDTGAGAAAIKYTLGYKIDV